MSYLPEGTECQQCKIYVGHLNMNYACDSCLDRGQKAQQAIALVLPELRRLAELNKGCVKPKHPFQAMVEILEKAK